MPVEKTQVISLQRVLESAQPREWRTKPASLEHGKRVLRPPFVLECDGKPIMVALTNECPADTLYEHFERIAYQKNDRSSGMVARSRVFGYMPRIVMRRDYCRESALHHELPETWQLLRQCAQHIAGVYKLMLPNHYDDHQLLAKQALPIWRIDNTPFTSGIINQSAALAYHKDSGNFPGVWSAMLVVRKHVDGGELVVPEIGASVDLPHGSLLFFDGQKWLHGVTSIVRTRPDGRRYSCVFYSLKQMWQCLTPSEELRRFRLEKTRRARARVQ